MNALGQFRLDGRVAVVTGGTKGLGKAMGLALAQAGATVVLCSRHEDEVAAASAELSLATGQAGAGIACDVTAAAAVDALVRGVTDRFGRIDVWINSAGINIRHPVEDFPVGDFERVLDVNLRGTWLCCRALAPLLKKQGSGSVVNVASVLGTIGLRERSAYCASKAGVIGLTRALALEWAPYGVRCNALCPGPFLTEINRALLDDPAKAQAVIGQTAFRRWADLREIQGPALFLASDASSYMTGATLVVDGGWSAA